MGRLVAVEFVTLDGVMQGFHAPDPRDGFDDGGWGHAFADDVQFAAALDQLPRTEAYLFGRRTYVELAQFWPFQPDSNPMAAHLNATPKHVLTSTMNALDWQNSHVLRVPLDTSVAALKREVQENIVVLGSQQMVNSLMTSGLVDEFRLFVHPLVLGSGRRLFASGAPMGLRLRNVGRTTTGVVMITYDVLGDPADAFDVR